MGKILFTYLNKAEKEACLPALFALLYENMHTTAPSSLSFDEERALWLSQVSPALDKAPRQIILCLADGELVWFLQYYTREKMLMVEEMQLRKPWQRTLLFRRLCKFLAGNLPPDIAYVEAYAERRNLYSQALMQKLGMAATADDPDAPFVHFRGPAAQIRQLFTP